METYDEKTILNCPYTNLIFDTRKVVHNHTFFEITFIIKGCCINKIHGEEKVMMPGDAMILKPEDSHSIEIKTKGRYYHRDVYCDKATMKKVCDTLSTDLYNEILNCKFNYFNISGTMLKALEQTLNIFNSYGSIKTKELDTLSKSVIATLLGCYAESKVSNKTSYPQWLNNFIDSLNQVENMSQDVEYLIKETNYSHGYLCREFKRYTGKTIVQYLTEIRIYYSTNLLRNSNLSIIEIANTVGYSNPNNYIRNFKEFFTLSPSQWRKKNKVL